MGIIVNQIYNYFKRNDLLTVEHFFQQLFFIQNKMISKKEKNTKNKTKLDSSTKKYIKEKTKQIHT